MSPKPLISTAYKLYKKKDTSFKMRKYIIDINFNKVFKSTFKLIAK